MRSYWEFKRSCHVFCYKSGKFKPCDKIDGFVRFYSEYFLSNETECTGPIVFAYNGADHVAVEKYMRKKLPDMKIGKHSVFTVHVSSDALAKWAEIKNSEAKDAILEEKDATIRTLVRMLIESTPLDQIASRLNLPTSKIEEYLRD